jgi:hypothetical protein
VTTTRSAGFAVGAETFAFAAAIAASSAGDTGIGVGTTVRMPAGSSNAPFVATSDGTASVAVGAGAATSADGAVSARVGSTPTAGRPGRSWCGRPRAARAGSDGVPFGRPMGIAPAGLDGIPPSTHSASPEGVAFVGESMGSTGTGVGSGAACAAAVAAKIAANRPARSVGTAPGSRAGSARPGVPSEEMGFMDASPR